MDDVLKRFLTESSLAEKIRLPARVVIRRTRLTPHDVNVVKAAGIYGPVTREEAVCELEVGGRRIAVGKIVKRGGERYFKVVRLLDVDEVKEANR